ncbi:hypothetical protein B0T16DRAFT_402060 [Cercophora newfieldiana]|uniref:Uncharacterized protein n=1 Tax=Cercophora newfieldiana TaxID=92897 RepID=A0AA39YS14_9PEZI|nr:hypothetical protein B0T16DRAFT_402060 [Cercophora newfieldiana]
MRAYPSSRGQGFLGTTYPSIARRFYTLLAKGPKEAVVDGMPFPNTQTPRRRGEISSMTEQQSPPNRQTKTRTSVFRGRYVPVRKGRHATVRVCRLLLGIHPVPRRACLSSNGPVRGETNQPAASMVPFHWSEKRVSGGSVLISWQRCWVLDGPSAEAGVVRQQHAESRQAWQHVPSFQENIGDTSYAPLIFPRGARPACRPLPV